MEFTGSELGIAIAAGVLIGFALRRGTPRQDLSGTPQMPSPKPATHTFAAALPPLDPAIDPAVSEAIAQALAQGHKIEAIKLLREATGLGLKESKDAVERMAGG